MKRRTRGSSRLETEDLGLHSSCGWECEVCLNLQWEPWGFYVDTVVNSGFLLSYNRGLGAKVELWMGIRIFFFQIEEETQSSSRVRAGESGLLPSCSGEFGIPLESWWETQGSSRVAAGGSELFLSSGGNSMFLSSCSMGFMVSLEY